jgi:hypothetical protein
MTTRVMPPGDGLHPSITVHTRSYTCALGATIDVPDSDAQVMAANGWTIVAGAGVGATTTRPANPTKGQQFHDTTLGYTIVWDGKVWRNPATGAAV